MAMIVLVASILFAPLVGHCLSMELPCAYVPKATDEHRFPELEVFPFCASRVGGQLAVADAHLTSIDTNSSGLGWILVDHQYYYVRPSDGTSLAVIQDGNGPDQFSDGLVRVLQRGKIQYFGRDFKLAIPGEFDWGWPFRDGRALVCLQCKPNHEDSGVDGHTEVVGGRWGFISRTGEQLVAIELSREEALALRPR